jgi:hypothetical protein
VRISGKTLMRIILTQPHNHNGIELPAGAAVELPEDLAAWLLHLGRAAIVTDAPVIPAPKPLRLRRRNSVILN